MILGIVGEIGVGKTTATQFFAKHGAHVIAVDKIVKHLYTEKTIICKIIKSFGEEVLDDDGKFSKKKLRQYVFENYQQLLHLETIIWAKLKPIIIKEIMQHKNNKFVVIDCALLFNMELHLFTDKILLIKASEKNKIARIKQRDNVGDVHVFNILLIQKKRLQLPKTTDFVIENNKSMKAFLKRLTKLFFQEINNNF